MSSQHAAITARQAVTLPPDLRHHRCDVARFALSHGSPLNLDAITVILACKALESGNDGRPFTRWSTRGLVSFLWGTVSEWCAGHSVVLPTPTAESLWTYLTFLDQTGQLASGSSDLASMREALMQHGGITRSGRGRHPAGRRSASVRSL